MRYRKLLKRASRWEQSHCCSLIRLATALKRVLGGQKLRLQKIMKWGQKWTAMSTSMLCHSQIKRARKTRLYPGCRSLKNLSFAHFVFFFILIKTNLKNSYWKWFLMENFPWIFDTLTMQLQRNVAPKRIELQRQDWLHLKYVFLSFHYLIRFF